MKQMASPSKTQRTSTSSTGFAEKLILQGHWFRRGNFAKYFIIILVAKQVTYNE